MKNKINNNNKEKEKEEEEVLEKSIRFNYAVPRIMELLMMIVKKLILQHLLRRQ